MSSGSPGFHLILDALDNYTEQTGINLKDVPFADKVKGCDSPGAILQLLEENVKAFKEYRDKHRKFIDCLSPVVQFVHSFSGILGEAAGLVPFQPAKLIFVGIDVLFTAAGGVSASYDALLELFECIGNFLKRLEIYTKISLSPMMTDIIVNMMVELVSVLALARKQIKQGRFKQFAKKLLGDTEIESILRRLDRLTQEETRMMDAQILEVVYGLMNNMKVVMDGGEASTSAIRKTLVTMQEVVNEINKMNRDHLQEKSRSWLSPPDPSKNQILARRDNRDGSAVWFTRGAVFESWNEAGCLLWIHGKPGSGKSILCSTVVQEAKAMCDAGLALVAYFYFDFRDIAKQDIRGLLSSVVTQLSAESDACCNILSDLYSEHNAGSQLPDDEALTQCLKDMLQLPDQPPVYLIVDAVDECPDSSGVVSPRERVLDLIEDLVESRLPNLRLCVTSRHETDILDVLEPLASHAVSLHDEDGQKQDILDYINSVVQSDRKMRRWRAQDRQLVIDALTERADGMFRWVFCQLEMLRRCFPTTIRRALDELPESLDETYERILLGIDKEKQKYAHRLFQCLIISIHPLRVEELAEILAVQLEAGRDSECDAEWRPEDARQAVLSACSSLITIADVGGSPVVQFAHFSVREFLTSDRLRLSAGGENLSRYHVILRSAHTVLAQACLIVLLSLDESVDWSAVGKRPLAVYAALHWVDHGIFEGVLPSIQDLTERLFDRDKPHFATWIWIYDFDRPWRFITPRPTQPKVSPLYYAALCGFPSVVDHLAVTRCGDVNAEGGLYSTPLSAASAKGHVDVCLALLRHGANINSPDSNGISPMHWALRGGHRDVMQLLLEHQADVDIRTDGQPFTPLYFATWSGNLENCRLLLEFGADPNFRDDDNHSLLHVASRVGNLEIVKLLHDFGASLYSRNIDGCTAMALASRQGHPEVVHILLERGADVDPRDDDESTPLHFASDDGYLDIVQDLLAHGADANLQRKDHQTSLHLASAAGHLEIAQLLVRHGAAVDRIGAYAETTLDLALREGKLEIARFLIEEGANLMSKDKDGRTPLHNASRHGDLGIVETLLAGGVDIDARDADQKTSLDLTSGDGKLEIVRFPIERGADVGCRDAKGCTPLHSAAGNGHLGVVLLFLGTGMNVHARNGNHNDPLMLASRGGHLEVSRVLIEHEADASAVNDEGWAPLHAASWYGPPDLVRLLLDHGADVDVQNADLWAPLHLASANGRLKVVQLLIERGADVYKQTNHQETPLGCASRNGQLEITRFLIHCVASVGSRDSKGQTPLHAAAEEGHLDVVELLLESGADIDVRNCNDESPLDLASHNRKHEVAGLLASRMVLK